jgi:hypothetical protein
MAYLSRNFYRSDGPRSFGKFECSPMSKINGPYLKLAFNGCDQIAKSHIAISGFSLSSELDISKSRSPILRWLISLATSTDLTALVLSGNLNGILRSLTLLLPIIVARLFIAIVITATTTVLAINDKYTLICFLLTEIANNLPLWH